MNFSEPYKSCFMMGSLRLVANFKNTVCLINGPSGCAFFCRNSVMMLNGYIHPIQKVELPKILTTNFDEDDVIFGAKKKLTAALKEIDQKMNPEIIFVFNCCVSEVIGEDLDDAILSVKDQVRAKMIPVKSAGFKGDHRVGMRHMNQVIFENLIANNNAEKVKDSVNILGDNDVHHNTTRELQEVLMDAGIKVIAKIPGHIPLADVEKSVAAQLNIVVCGSASYHLAFLFDKYKQIPYCGKTASFYSIEESYKSYRYILKYFNKDSKHLDILRNEAIAYNQKYIPMLKGKRVFLIAGARRAVGYAKVLKEIGMNIEFIFSESNENFTSKSEFLEYANNVMCDEWNDSIRDKILNEKPDLVITTIPELTAPLETVSRTVEDFAGFKGSNRMAEYICRIMEGNRGTVYWQTTEM